MSHLKIYDAPGPDGQRGGTPHVHLLCTEMYVVLAGSGRVEIIDAHGFSSVELALNDALVFTPGTLHRLINPNGDLEILVIMQNSGLPERGDNVVCFTEEWLASDDVYREAMQVRTLEDALRRRDRGIEGFLALKAAFARDLQTGQHQLEQFFTQANARTAALRSQWEQVVRAGALAEAQESLDRLRQLDSGDTSALMGARHQHIATAPTVLGFCGHIGRYFDHAAFSAEGILKL